DKRPRSVHTACDFPGPLQRGQGIVYVDRRRRGGNRGHVHNIPPAWLPGQRLRLCAWHKVCPSVVSVFRLSHLLIISPPPPNTNNATIAKKPIARMRQPVDRKLPTPG